MSQERRGRRYLYCTCGQCRSPFALVDLDSAVVIIESLHHGRRHRNAVSLDELARMIQPGTAETTPQQEGRSA